MESWLPQLNTFGHSHELKLPISFCYVFYIEQRQLGLLFWLFKGAFKVSSGTPEWYISSYGTDFEIPYTIYCIPYTIYHL